MTAGWKNFLKIKRDDRHTYRNIHYSIQNASILIQNAPKSLAAGAPSKTLLGELTVLSQAP